MDFDALHDPVPPRPSSEEFAAVARRARAIRHRRRTFAGTATVVVVVAMSGLVVSILPTAAPTLRPDSTVIGPVETLPLLTPDSTVPTTDPSPVEMPACQDIRSLPWMPDGSLPGEPVMRFVAVGAAPYAQFWVDSTGQVTHWNSVTWPFATKIGPPIGVPIDVPGAVVTGVDDGPSTYSAVLQPTTTGVILEVVRAGDCSMVFEFGGSEATAATTLTAEALQPLVAEWLDAWNLYSATVVTFSGDTWCFDFGDISQEMPCTQFPVDAPEAATDPVVVALANVPLGDVGVNLVMGLVTDPSLAPSPMFPLGGVAELAPGDPRRFVWGLVSPRLCAMGVASSDLFLATVCAVDGIEPVIPPDRVGMTVGIDDKGDAVLLRPDGSATLLFDGPEPGSVATEGDPALVDHASLSADGTRAVVSTCCEPLSGSYYVIDTSTLETVGTGLGHLAEFTSTGDIVAASGASLTLIDDAPRHVTDLLEELPERYTVVDLAVINDVVYAIAVDYLSRGPTTPVLLHRIDVDGADPTLSVDLETIPKSFPFGTFTETPRLVGSTIWLFVTDGRGTLHAFGLDTLAETNAIGQFDQTPLWVGNQVFTVTVSDEATTLGFEDSFVRFPGVRLTFARF